jgi:hypothetical protein
MRHNDSHAARQPSQPTRAWRKVNVWRIKGPLFVVLGLLGFFGEVLHVGLAPVAAGMALLLPVIGFRDYWKETKFWITVLILGAIQVPLVLLVSPLVKQLKFLMLLTFGVSDALLVGLAISWVCLDNDRSP